MDFFSEILSHLELKGTLYFRTSFSPPWGVEVPAFEKVVRFHYAHRGRCFVRIKGTDNLVCLEQGDLLLIAKGAGHKLFSDPQAEEAVLELDRVVEQSGFTGQRTLVIPSNEQAEGFEAQLVCGHFSFDKKSGHPLLEALPEFIHINDYSSAAGHWLEASLKVIGEEAHQPALGSDLIARKASEIIFAQTLRTYFAHEDTNTDGLAAYADQEFAPVLQAIHSDPARAWTLEQMAKVAGMSRTAFANSFHQRFGVPPMAYVTDWRMEIARKRLANTNQAIIEIAESIGYLSEASFGRVFKKKFGLAPGRYRKEQSV